MVTINVPKSKVTCPQDVIDFLRKPENQNIFGSSKATTETCDSNCVKLRHFFGDPEVDRYGVHFEIQRYHDDIWVEIHAEEHDTPVEVREFLKKALGLERKNGPTDSYRTATHKILCKGRFLVDVVKDIDDAVCELYKKYEKYLVYVRKFWDEHKSLNGCNFYVDFINNQ